MATPRERFTTAWSLHCPLSYEPKVPWRGRFLIEAEGDALVTAPHTDLLWNHWGKPRRYSFSGGHILQVYRTDYHRELGRFLAGLGLVSPERVEGRIRR